MNLPSTIAITKPNNTDTNTTQNQQTIEILKYWHLTEFFEPFNLNAACSHPKSKYLNITEQHLRSPHPNKNPLPWLSALAQTKAGTDPNKRYDYCLYLLPFNKNALTRICNQLYPLTRHPIKQIEFEQRLADEGETCFAQLRVDKNGFPNFHSLSVSTLPWAMGKLITHSMDSLNSHQYEEEKKKLQLAIDELSRHIGLPHSELITDNLTDEKSGVLTLQGVLALLPILKKWARFAPEHPLVMIIELRELRPIKRPQLNQLPYSITHENTDEQQSSKEKQAATQSDEEESDQAEPITIERDRTIPILNSFYIDDLEKVINHLAEYPHTNLQRYINGNPSKQRLDLYSPEAQTQLLKQLQPEKTNLGRWPRHNDITMSLMQQLAINLSINHQDADSLFSVNGPPGTGKTTLLQDIIADNIVKRAQVLASFKNSQQTFIGKRSLSYLNSDKLNISILDPKLTGFEMLVASSNNTAVENISKELLLQSSIDGEHLKQCQYLHAVAAKISADHKDHHVIPLDDKAKPWGLIAIALGNYRNRQQFLNRAFWGPEAKDQTHQRVNKKEYLTLWEWRRQYRGPNFIQASKQFKQAEQALQNYLDQIKQLATLHQLLNDEILQQEFNKQHSRLKSLQRQVKKSKQQQEEWQQSLTQSQQRKSELAEDIERQQRYQSKSSDSNDNIESAKLYEQNQQQLEQLWQQSLQQYLNAETQLQQLNHKLQTHQQEIEELEKIIKQKEKQRKKQQIQYQQLHSTLQTLSSVPSSKNLINDNHSQLHAPWQNSQLNQLRSELFISALKLHEAWLHEVLKNGEFIDNVFAACNLLANKRPLEIEAEQQIWQSLFMWIPVVSSTFASIGNQFRHVGASGLGWLLIDEAGQALPQAVVGAMWRCRHVIAVGDPRQIEPVLTTPASLIISLAHHKLAPGYQRWLPCNTSVQVLADQANPCGAAITVGSRKLWIGCPLRIHRRCLEPMFSVANQISYDNKMIQAREIHSSEQNDFPLGKSCWLDISAAATDKQYVNAQGKLFTKLFAKLYQHHQQLPPVYVITPFKRVKTNLQRLIRKTDHWSAHLKAGTRLPDSKQLSRWCRTHIGTIHTFQGKESATILFILGADHAQMGAVNWASSKPNLLNVALTRAKDRIYIIGDFELWAPKRYFNQVASSLERRVVSNLDDILLAGRI